MTSRLLLNLGLLVAAAVLLLVVVYRPGIAPDNGPQPLTGLASVDAVTGIRVERVGREPLQFIKEASGWVLQQGDSRLPASESQLRSLLRLPLATSNTAYAASSLDLGQAGLEPAQVTVSFDDTVITLGKTSPLDNRRYARAGDNVLLVADNYPHLVNADWSNFVSRRLLPNGATITRLALPEVTVLRDDSGKWSLQPSPDGYHADDVTRLIENWQSASALYVKRYAGETGETIAITTASNDTPVNFLLLSQNPELVLASPAAGIQYHLPGSLADSLLSIANPDPAEDAAE